MPKKRKTKTSSNSVTRPNPEVVPHLRKVYGEADSVYDNSPKRYDGDFVAGFNQNQLQGQQKILNQTDGLDSGAAALRQLGVNTAEGKFLDYNTSPLSSYFAAQQAQQRQAFQENQQRLINDNAIQQGAYGGSRQGVQQALAERGFQERLMQQQAAVALANYQNERARQERAYALLNQANQLYLEPGRQQVLIGDRQQTQKQAELQGDLQKFELNRQLPWQDVINYSNVIAQHNPVGWGGQVNTTGRTENKSSGLGNYLNSALGLGYAYAGLGGKLPNIFGGKQIPTISGSTQDFQSMPNSGATRPGDYGDGTRGY